MRGHPQLDEHIPGRPFSGTIRALQIGHYAVVPFNVELRDEAGVTLDSAVGVEGLADVLPSADDSSSAVLRFIDPYGDTVINRLQARPLVAELQSRVHLLRDETARDAVAAVADLVDRCADGVHLYVWFLGD